MKMSIQLQYRGCVLGFKTKKRSNHGLRSSTQKPCSLAVSSVLVKTCDEGESESQPSKSLLGPGRPGKTVGIIGGLSGLSTLIFVEKLMWWGSRRGSHCPPFVLCSDTALHSLKPQLAKTKSSFDSNPHKNTKLAQGAIVESLKRKRAFLEKSGASCVVMPCHLSHIFHSEIYDGSSLPFLHVGECVAEDLLAAKLRPLEVGGNVKIGVLASNAALAARIYQEQLQSRGFEVIVPDKATMEHIVIPSVEALKRRDVKGARNLLRIAVQILLMRAANTVIVASDEMRCLLPKGDPLLRKCTDPMDALARSAIRWAASNENVRVT